MKIKLYYKRASSVSLHEKIVKSQMSGRDKVKTNLLEMKEKHCTHELINAEVAYSCPE